MWCLKDLYINKGNMSLLQDLYKSAKKILKRISVIPLTFKKRVLEISILMQTFFNETFEAIYLKFSQ